MKDSRRISTTLKFWICGRTYWNFSFFILVALFFTVEFIGYFCNRWTSNFTFLIALGIRVFDSGYLVACVQFTNDVKELKSDTII